MDLTCPTCSVFQWELRYAFNQLLVGIAEIHGMLDVMNVGEDAIITKLLGLPRQDLKTWLDRFEHNGEIVSRRLDELEILFPVETKLVTLRIHAKEMTYATYGQTFELDEKVDESVSGHEKTPEKQGF